MSVPRWTIHVKFVQAWWVWTAELPWTPQSQRCLLSGVADSRRQAKRAAERAVRRHYNPKQEKKDPTNFSYGYSPFTEWSGPG